MKAERKWYQTNGSNSILGNKPLGENGEVSFKVRLDKIGFKGVRVGVALPDYDIRGKIG